MSGEKIKTKAELAADANASLRAAIETVARGVGLEPSERAMFEAQLDGYFGPVEATVEPEDPE